MAASTPWLPQEIMQTYLLHDLAWLLKVVGLVETSGDGHRGTACHGG